eukprot:1016236_1
MSSHHIDTARITYKQDDTTPIMSKPHQPKPFAGAPSQEGDSANACTHNLQRQSQGKYLWSKTLSNLQEMTSGASLHIIGSIGMRYEDSIAIFERIMHGIIGLYVHAKYYCEYPMMAAHAHIKQCDTLANHEPHHDALYVYCMHKIIEKTQPTIHRKQEKNIWMVSVGTYLRTLSAR